MDPGRATPSRSLRRGGQGAASAIRISEVQEHRGGRGFSRAVTEESPRHGNVDERLLLLYANLRT